MNLREQQGKAWRLAPDDAKWIAQDSDGRFWWYDYKPSSDSYSWLISMRLESDEGYLFDGKINGWDWRDTLQSKEEWEAMNKQDEKWMPEVGQECQYTCGEDENCKWITCEFVGKLSSGSHVVVIEGGYKSYHPWQIRYRPIQTQNEILAMPDTERDAYAAEVCMGWIVIDGKPYGAPAGYEGQGISTPVEEWRPSQPTEKGKAQCFDLILKFNLTVDVENESVMGPGAAGDCVSIHGKVTQAKIVTAAIRCALAKKEK